MKKQTRKLIISLILVTLFLVKGQVSLANIEINKFSKSEYTEEFKRYLQLTEEEKKKVIQPKMFSVGSTNLETKNPLKIARNLRSTLEPKYSLKDVIPNNIVVKNQKSTNTCWTFATLSSLETNLALANQDKIKYDFSERHMEYAMSRNFLNGVVNSKGLNRTVGSGGNWYMAQAYLTNGAGAIDESAMQFENNEKLIDISEIQNKEVTSQVYDIVEFQKDETDKEKVKLKEQIKQHIRNYGAVFANIHGATPSSEYNNNQTGAIYCDVPTASIDHAVSIIGWDDNYDINNFNKDRQPKNKGAWIIKNSWGEKQEYSLAEMKAEIFKAYPNGEWTEASQITDEIAKQTFETLRIHH